MGAGGRQGSAGGSGAVPSAGMSPAGASLAASMAPPLPVRFEQARLIRAMQAKAGRSNSKMIADRLFWDNRAHGEVAPHGRVVPDDAGRVRRPRQPDERRHQ